MSKKYKVAIVGATGVVGRTALKVLEEKNFPNVTYILFSSKKSAGETVKLSARILTSEEDKKAYDVKITEMVFDDKK